MEWNFKNLWEWHFSSISHARHRYVIIYLDKIVRLLLVFVHHVCMMRKTQSTFILVDLDLYYFIHWIFFKYNGTESFMREFDSHLDDYCTFFQLCSLIWKKIWNKPSKDFFKVRYMASGYPLSYWLSYMAKLMARLHG